MTDTAQPIPAAETEVASDPIADAANAFKVNLGQIAPPERPRDENGRFAKLAPEGDEEIEAEADEQPIEGEADAEAESHDEETTDEAAEEAQPEPVDLPTSWPSEHAEMWNSLPPEAQAVIREREGQREAAVNAKFQEAANVKRANEALITEADANRQRFAELSEFALNLLQPQPPSRTMLDPRSADYNPDQYHLAKAQYDDTIQTLTHLDQQRQHAVAQQQQAHQAALYEEIAAINEQYGEALIRDVPDFVSEDQTVSARAIQDIADYGIQIGIPRDTFLNPELRAQVTAPMWHALWKAKQYDQMKTAQAKVAPKAPKPAAPPVKPGVTTPRSAIQATARKKDFDRLARTGSVADGAAVWKQFL